MGLGLALESENLRQAGSRPKVDHPSFRSRLKVEGRDTKGEPSGRSFHLKGLDGNFGELGLCSSTSPHRKSMPSRPPKVNVEDSIVQKRSSVYQTSSEVKMMKLKEGQRRMKLKEGHRKLKLKEGSRNETTYINEAFLSFEIVDSSSQIYRDDGILLCKQTRSPLGALNAEKQAPSFDSNNLIPAKSTEFLDLSFRDLPGQHLNLSNPCSSGSALGNNSSMDTFTEDCLLSRGSKLPCVKKASELVDKGCFEEPKLNFSQKITPDIDVKSVNARDGMHILPKSFSTKVGMLESPFQAKKEIPKTSPRVQFSPVKRIFDPIMKSKSLRNPSPMGVEKLGSTVTNHPSISKNGSFCRSLLSDFAKTTQNVENDRCLVVSDEVMAAASSPAHLHAILKVEFKHDAPSFEFSVKDPEDVFYAKMWKTDSALNWAYTFHSCKRKSYSTGRGTKERHGQPTSMIGQMQVSCFLCSEASENGSLANYMATEFMLYDVAQTRRSFCIEERSDCSSDSIQPFTVAGSDSLVSETDSSSEVERYQQNVKRTSVDCDSDPSTSYPWSPTELHPHLEIAAITIQIPFTKGNVSDEQIEETFSEENSIGVPRDGNFTNCLDHSIVKVITPSGSHGLPNTEEVGPSSLLDRWRVGGGCDCGGWDMACPIVVFDNPCCSSVDYSVAGSNQPMLLFFQGKKEKIPALCIKSDGKGQYSVDFHAHLSALQAFSICIAILHGSDASRTFGQGSKNMLYSNSLKLLLEKEVKQLIEVVAEEKRKVKKITEESYLLDPPFSPMGRS